MTKQEFKAKFPAAVYDGKTKTFYLCSHDYTRALHFLMHKMVTQFRVTEITEPAH